MKFRHFIISVAAVAVTAIGLFGLQWLSSADAADARDARPGMPIFEVDPSWPQVPPKWKLGNVSAIAFDDKDNVFVLHRPLTLPDDQLAVAAPPVMVFDSSGKFLQAWGGPGAGYEWPEREHGITIDHKGFVWIGGNHCAEDNRGLAARLKPVGDDQMLKFTQAGKFVMQIGKSNQSTGNADTRNLRQPADAAYYPKTNELFVADGYGNHRVIVFDADSGAFKRMWGAFSNKPVDNAPCPPVNLGNKEDGDGPGQFGRPHAIRISNDGLVYVGDHENRRLQVFTPDGKFVRQAMHPSEPFGRSLALSADPEQRYLYTGGAKGVFVVDRRTMETIGQIIGGGVIGSGHEIATDSKGNLYIAHLNLGAQKLIFKGIAPAP